MRLLLFHTQPRKGKLGSLSTSHGCELILVVTEKIKGAGGNGILISTTDLQRIEMFRHSRLVFRDAVSQLLVLKSMFSVLDIDTS